MRKITQQAVNAFYQNKPFSSGNTRVTVDDKATKLILHNTTIAEKRGGQLTIFCGNWKTYTTKERLNGLQGVSIQQKKGEWYLNGELWDGSSITI